MPDGPTPDHAEAPHVAAMRKLEADRRAERDAELARSDELARRGPSGPRADTAREDVDTTVERHRLLQRALRRADEVLEVIDAIPAAHTQGARNAVRDARLAVLERLHDDVRQALA